MQTSFILGPGIDTREPARELRAMTQAEVVASMKAVREIWIAHAIEDEAEQARWLIEEFGPKGASPATPPKVDMTEIYARLPPGGRYVYGC